MPGLAKIRKNLPLPNIRTGAFEPLLYYNMITQRFLTLLLCVIYEDKNIKKEITTKSYNNKIKN